MDGNIELLYIKLYVNRRERKKKEREGRKVEGRKVGWGERGREQVCFE